MHEEKLVVLLTLITVMKHEYTNKLSNKIYTTTIKISKKKQVL